MIKCDLCKSTKNVKGYNSNFYKNKILYECDYCYNLIDLWEHGKLTMAEMQKQLNIRRLRVKRGLD